MSFAKFEQVRVQQPEQASLDGRVEIAGKCHDMDDVPRVPNAGQVETLEDGTRVQLMHNGLRVLADAYLGPWTTRLIEMCHGCHEPQEERVFYEVLARLGEDATMIELGGFWAFYSLWFLSSRKSRRGVVLEPDPKHLIVGQRNALLNGLAPTFVHGFAGSVPSDPVPFQTEDSGEAMVSCFSVSRLMEMHGIEQLDLLHCDIQGAEFDVLLSCKQIFEQQRIKFVFVSTHDFRISGDPLMHQRCLEIVQRCGGRIIAEHDVHESFSGDGLIAAYFGGDALMSTPVSVSRNRYSESLFRNPLYDLAETRAQAEALGTALQSQTANLRNALQAEQAQTVNLRNALQAEQAQTVNLRNALRAEQSQNANLTTALRAEQAQVNNLHNVLQTHADHLLARVQQLDVQLAALTRYRGVLGSLREIDDRLTGGGLRSLSKRMLASLVRWAMRNRTLLAAGRAALKPFPTLATSLYRLAAPDSATPSLPSASSDGQPPSNSIEIPSALPASARTIHLKLQAALSDERQDR